MENAEFLLVVVDLLPCSFRAVRCFCTSTHGRIPHQTIPTTRKWSIFVVSLLFIPFLLSRNAAARLGKRSMGMAVVVRRSSTRKNSLVEVAELLPTESLPRLFQRLEPLNPIHFPFERGTKPVVPRSKRGTWLVSVSVRGHSSASDTYAMAARGGSHGTKRCFDNEMDDEVDVLDEELRRALVDAEELTVFLSKTDTNLAGNGVYIGLAGLALMYFHLVQAMGANPEAFLSLGNGIEASDRERCLEQALEIVGRCSTDTRRNRTRITFLEGGPGISIIKAIVKHACEDDGYKKNLHQLVDTWNNDVVLCSPEECELMYGRAGWLYACLYARKYLEIRDVEFLNGSILEALRTILDMGRKNGDSTWPLMYDWHGRHYLGAAHGLCGILMVLLHLRPELETIDTGGGWRDDIQGSISALLNVVLPSGNLPSSLENRTDNLVHWCHGAPGLVMLLCKAYAEFGTAEYLEAAKTSADVIWGRGLLKKGLGLCHGISGNGYAFLALYRTTGESKWLMRARHFAAFMAKHLRTGRHNVFESALLLQPDRPASLYEGLAGATCFLADVLTPSTSYFPGYEL